MISASRFDTNAGSTPGFTDTLTLNRPMRWNGLKLALAPIAIGLILASGYTLALGADRSPGAVALTVGATAALAFTRVNPVWILLAASVAGVAGLA